MVGRRNRYSDQLLDIAQERCLIGITQGDGDTFRSGSRCATYAVDIRFRHVGKVEIDDVTDAIDVDAACGDVSGDKSTHFAFAEAGQHAIALVLRFVPVNRLGGNAGPKEPAHHLVGTMLGACEYKGAVNRFAFQDARENLRA